MAICHTTGIATQTMGVNELSGAHKPGDQTGRFYLPPVTARRYASLAVAIIGQCSQIPQIASSLSRAFRMMGLGMAPQGCCPPPRACQSNDLG